MTSIEVLRPSNVVICAVADKKYVADDWPLIANLLKGGHLFDLKSKLDRAQKPQEIDLWRLQQISTRRG
jgi:UDP-N-acetyl-D-glucosamine/UDP-N-acetyl-D-galactosamine dehydrogenase